MHESNCFKFDQLSEDSQMSLIIAEMAHLIDFTPS
jgi:hypothetical protein